VSCSRLRSMRRRRIYMTEQPPEPEPRMTAQPPLPDFMTSQPPDPDFMTAHPPLPDFMIAHPPEPDFMTEQPPDPDPFIVSVCCGLFGGVFVCLYMFVCK
jgi:hypothetical protein